MTKNIRSSREFYPDLLRTTAAIFVILLHVIMPYFSSRANYGRPLWWVLAYINELTRTGVPIFFMLSGYLLLSNPSAEDIPSFYKKRFSKLWLAFVVWSVIYYICYRVSAGEPVLDPEFFRQLFNEGTAYHLWYLYSLAILYLFLPFFAMIAKRASLGKMILLLSLLLFQPTIKPFLNTLLSGKLYINLTADGVVGYFGYALLGYILGHYELPKAAKYVVIGTGMLSFAVFPQLNGRNIVTSGDFFWNGGYTLNHYLEAAAIFLLAKELLPTGRMSRYPKICAAVSKLSSLTFSVYLVHVLVLEAVQEYLTPMLDFLPPSVIMAVAAVIVTVVSFGLAWGWGRMKRACLRN